MQLVEKHIIRRGTQAYDGIDHFSFLSKNLYNATLYALRQHFFKTEEYLPYAKLCKQFTGEHNVDYEALPRKVSQQTMRLVDSAMKSFFKSIEEYKEHPEKFTGRPHLPKYMEKKEGRCCLTFTAQAISKKELETNGVVVPSGTDLRIPTKLAYAEIACVRIVRKTGAYVVEIVYNSPDTEIREDNGRYMGVDLGVSNFATLTSNVDRFAPVIIKGGAIKSFNRYYNKETGRLRSVLETRNGKKTSRKADRLGLLRENKITDFLHKASRWIVNQAVSSGISVIAVGKNTGWKQGADMGKVNNQNFVQIPYARFISMLEYKCAMEGIRLVAQEESYTSKCSFLDMEKICKHEEYKGRRKHRGLFISSEGKQINADVNGSYNIIRKCRPEAFADGVGAVVVQPRVIKTLN